MLTPELEQITKQMDAVGQAVHRLASSANVLHVQNGIS